MLGLGFNPVGVPLLLMFVGYCAPLTNSWIITIIWFYNIALNRTPNIDCSWVGAVPKFVLLLYYKYVYQNLFILIPPIITMITSSDNQRRTWIGFDLRWALLNTPLPGLRFKNFN